MSFAVIFSLIKEVAQLLDGGGAIGNLGCDVSRVREAGMVKRI
ncbi:MAG: hypothetical protein PVH64_01290 [Bacillota bacterium]